MPLTQGGWLFPHGGWIDPASLCAAQCAAAGERLERRFGVEVARVERVRRSMDRVRRSGQSSRARAGRDLCECA